MENYKSSNYFLSILKIFGVLSVIIGLLAIYLSIASFFSRGIIIEKGSDLIPQFIYGGCIAIIGGIAVLKRKVFGRWLFFFAGFLGILRSLINIPLNIFHLSLVPSPYPHWYKYGSIWILIIFSFMFYIFLMIFFSLPPVKKQFEEARS